MLVVMLLMLAFSITVQTLWLLAPSHGGVAGFSTGPLEDFEWPCGLKDFGDHAGCSYLAVHVFALVCLLGPPWVMETTPGRRVSR